MLVTGSKDGREYALKDLATRDSERIQRFKREVQILTGLDHPNIVRIFKWDLRRMGFALGPWYVMEYLPGGTLREYLDSLPSRTPQRRFTLNQVILPVCIGLELAHDRGIVHRDLKPENLMFANTERSVIKIIDWGLGKVIGGESTPITVPGTVMGTRPYCAPEQWFAQTVDARVDIFSLGVIMYEMLTGNRPAIYDDQRQALPVNSPSHYQPAIVQELDRLIIRAIQIDPAHRFQTIAELILALRSLPDQAFQGG